MVFFYHASFPTPPIVLVSDWHSHRAALVFYGTEASFAPKTGSNILYVPAVATGTPLARLFILSADCDYATVWLHGYGHYVAGEICLYEASKGHW